MPNKTMAFEGYCTANEVRATFGKDENGDYLLKTSIISDSDIQNQIIISMSELYELKCRPYAFDELFPDMIVESISNPIKFRCIRMTHARIMRMLYG